MLTFFMPGVLYVFKRQVLNTLFFFLYISFFISEDIYILVHLALWQIRHTQGEPKGDEGLSEN